MKKVMFAAVVAVLVLGVTVRAQQLAFPGAEGYGCYATGGRGGDVYHVTNLADFNDYHGANEPNIPGSLRYGIRTATGPRTIVFDVSGYIDLKARLEFDTNDITIAGQTAPGDGITIRHWDVRLYKASNVIIRYLRVRPGRFADQIPTLSIDISDPNHLNGGLDCLSNEGSTNIIIDHCSFSWSSDEISSVTGDSNDITVQWTLYTEPFNWAVDPYHKDPHAYCSLMRPAKPGRYTHHHNLYTDMLKRATRFGNYGDGFSNEAPSRYDWANNVVYNWGDEGTYSYDNTLTWDYLTREAGPDGNDGEFVDLNFIRNYFIQGVNTIANYAYTASGIPNPSHRQIWAENNYWDSDKDANVDGYDGGWSIVTGDYTQLTDRHPITVPLTIDTAPVAYDRVLEYAGDWLVRDDVDVRNIQEVRDRSGRIAVDQNDSLVGGYPTLAVESRDANTFDTDDDGMPNAWETARGLDPNDSNDRNIVQADGYTNLEKYLNYLVVWQDGIPGDYNADNKVDWQDLDVFLEDWLVYDPVFPPAGDLYDDDNFVDLRDFAVFAANWLNSDRPPMHPATNPNPANEAEGASTNTVLTWSPDANAVSHDVYFGTNSSDVDSSTTPVATTSVATYNPGTLNYLTTYYWRIDESDGDVTVKGDVWSFTTGDIDYDPTLVGWWKLDETSGTTASNSGRTGSGTLYGNPVWTSGWIDGALQFDGADDYVYVGDHTLLRFSQSSSFTISCWAKPDSQTGYMVYQKDPLPEFGVFGYCLYYNYSNNRFEFEVESSFYHSNSVLANASAGSWHHVTAVYSNKSMKIYLNGQLKGSGTFGGDAGTTTTNYGLAIGAYYEAIGQWDFFDGILDDVRIYNRALSDAEIMTIYARGAGKASNPNPSSAATDIDTQAVLTWSPGLNAVSHRVYFGTSFADVNSSTTPVATTSVATYDPGTLNYSTTYYWRIDEYDGAVTVKGNIWNFTTMSGKALNPSPANAAPSVDPHTTLSWSAAPYATSHDVYIGTSSSEVNSSITPVATTGVATYNPGTLNYETTYYWRIDEFDGAVTVKGDIWSFTTMAGKASGPSPANGSGGIDPTTATLAWTAAPYATSHDVYLGTSFADVNSSTTPVTTTNVASYNPGILNYATTYYWRIDEFDGNITIKGDIWSFTTMSGKATNPSPASSAGGVDPNITLTWSAAPYATSHDVYFGTSASDVNSSTTPVTTTSTATYNPGTLDYATTYYWRIDEFDGAVTVKGDIWSFTTCTQAAGPDLVGWWKLDETEGTTAFDSAGTNHGTLNGNPVWTTGQITGALAFDGTDDYVDCGNNTSLDITGSTSILAWVKFNSVSGYQTILAKRGGASDSISNYALRTNTNKLEFYYKSGSTWHIYATSNANLSTGNWYHIAVTFTYGTGSSIKCYRNGVPLTGSWTSGNGNAPAITNTNPLTIGALTNDERINGIIDDVRIYNRALTATEVMAIYLAGKAFNPNPGVAAANIDTESVLTWSAGLGAVEHDVYLGTSFADVNSSTTPVTTTTADVNSYDPGTLNYGTTYYWRIDEFDGAVMVKGNIWSFTTLSGKASNPSPSNAAGNIAPDITLSWSAATYATSHDVYFGTSSSEVDSSTTPVATTSSASYDPGTLNYSTTYYWRIDEFDGAVTVKGDIWSFTTCTQAGPGCVGWWKLDETSGTTAYDSALTNHGTLNGNPVWTSGQIDGALQLDGTGDYINVPHNAVLNMPSAITITAWIQLNSLTRAHIVTKQPSGTAGSNYPGNYEFDVDQSTGCLQFLHQTSTGKTYSTYASTGTVTIGNWYHVTVTLAAGGNVCFYINGSPAGFSAQSGAFGILTPQPVRIGIRKDSTSGFNGIIDDVRIYNRALSDAEVLQIYQDGLP